MKWIVLAASAIFAAAAVDAGQEQLSAAKELYASAAYEDALSVLTRLSEGDGAPALSRQADEYRAFCLYALGRTGEAEKLAESLIRRDPLIQLDRNGASPRIEAMFTTVRKRLLPSLIREEYRAARAALDQKRPVEADPHLTQASRMLAEAQGLGIWDDAMADLRVLVDGFIELNRAAAARAPDSAVQPPASREASAAAAPMPPPAATAVARTYTLADADVVPPVAIRQQLPGPPAGLLAIMSQKKGLLDVEIDESGAVQQAVLRTPMNQVYDQLIVKAARLWRYRPAIKAGVPVRYLKTIAIDVKD